VATVDGKAAGLFMLYDPTRQHRDHKPDDELYIWRFMVGLQFQRKAIGRAMMREIIRMAHAMPQIKFITLSYVPRAGNPKPFYEKFGFRETGKDDGDGELEMKVSVADAVKFL
jgi:diamine N-acetyltransferase